MLYRSIFRGTTVTIRRRTRTAEASIEAAAVSAKVSLLGNFSNFVIWAP